MFFFPTRELIIAKLEVSRECILREKAMKSGNSCRHNDTIIARLLYQNIFYAILY